MDQFKNALDAYIPFLIGVTLLHFVWDYELTYGIIVLCVLGNLSFLVLKAIIIRNNTKTVKR